MEKITVEICCGTACYILGASQLMELESSLPEDCRDKVEFIARPCLELCERENIGGAPYVKINDKEIVCEATADKVITKILTLLGKDTEKA